MNELQEELVMLMRQAKIYTGVLQSVYDKGIFSQNHLQRVKSGDRKIKDDKDNRAKVKRLIKLLERGIEKAKLNAIEVTTTPINK